MNVQTIDTKQAANYLTARLGGDSATWAQRLSDDRKRIALDRIPMMQTRNRRCHYTTYALDAWIETYGRRQQQARVNERLRQIQQAAVPQVLLLSLPNFPVGFSRPVF